MSVADVIIEIAKTQPLLQAADMTYEIKQAAVDGVIAKIKMLKAMATSDASKLCATAGGVAGSPQHFQRLKSAIDASLLAALASSGRKSPTEPELVTTPLNYLTAADWLVIQEPGQLSPENIINIIAKRLRKIRVTHRQLSNQYCQARLCTRATLASLRLRRSAL